MDVFATPWCLYLILTVKTIVFAHWLQRWYLQRLKLCIRPLVTKLKNKSESFRLNIIIHCYRVVLV